jgi:hypothetical protein
MKVIAAEGLQVPKEDKPREYITSDAAVDVEPTAYYLRRLADKELTEVGVDQENPTGKSGSSKKAT